MCYFLVLRMKRKYYSWDECVNLREVKVSCTAHLLLLIYNCNILYLKNLTPSTIFSVNGIYLKLVSAVCMIDHYCQFSH